MPRPSDILGGRRSNRKVTLVGHAPERCNRGVALTDGASHFEIIDRHVRPDGTWLHLENMELHAGGWFHMRDVVDLRFAGNAQRIRERQGWA